MGAVVAVIGALSARAERRAAEAAANTAERHMVAAELSASTMAQMAGSLKVLAESGAPAPLEIRGAAVVNVSGGAVTVEDVLNRREYEKCHLPLAVPVTIAEGESVPLDLEQRYSEAPLPRTLALRVSGVATPITLALPRRVSPRRRLN